MACNTGPHKRKFLRSPGRYIDENSAESEADLVFWGEWEGPSRIAARWVPVGRKPRALHDPYWSTPPSGPRQNTDPWVFGPAFRYSNCKQTTVHGATNMQRLPPGSLIVFGSTLDGEFVVDTVFVVAAAQPWTPSETTDMPVDDAFRQCTVESVRADDNASEASFTLYSGATPENPVHAMYSFVPARRADDPDHAFARPAVRLPEINAASRQSAKGANDRLPISDVRTAWRSLRDQVREASCVLAVHLDTPPRRPT